MSSGAVSGTLPPIPTFLTQADVVDEDAVGATVRRLLDAGVDGIVALGTSGEGMALDELRRVRVLAAVRAAASHATVVVGCHGQTAAEALGRVETAAAGSATAALVPPPFYYHFGQAALVDHYVAIADRSPLPILLYHIPQLTKNGLEPEAVAELRRHERIVGMKDSHGAAGTHLEFLRLQTDGFRVLQGLAALLLSSYAAGAAGGITPVSALFPELELGLRQALADGDVKRAGAHLRRIGVVASVLRSGGYPLVTNLKAVAAVLGLGDPRVLDPGPTAVADHLERVRRTLTDAQLLPARTG